MQQPLTLRIAVQLLGKGSSDLVKFIAATNPFQLQWIKYSSSSSGGMSASVPYSEAPAGAPQLLRDAVVRRATLLGAARYLQLHWASPHAAGPSSFPYSWLRDNCQCPACFHPVSRSRTVDWMKCDVTRPPKQVQVSPDGLSVLVEWWDTHRSHFSAAWLHARRFEQDTRDAWSRYYKQKKHVWGSALEEQFPRKRFEYRALLESNASLLAWLLELERRGVAMVEGAGSSNEGAVRGLAERVAFIRRTHYGEEFSVRNKTEPSNVAYTGQPLQLHTDLPYYEYKPGVNMLHCLMQAEGEGGENQLVDTLRVTEQLKNLHPHHFLALSTIPVDWTDEGEEEGKRFRSLHRAPVICEDWQGEIVRVNYSQPQRDSHFCVPLEQVEPWYDALRTFTQLMLQPDNLITYKLKSGEILCFDNLRVCHGRSGYEPAPSLSQERHLVGAYLDWDEIRSRTRVLLKQQH